MKTFITVGDRVVCEENPKLKKGFVYYVTSVMIHITPKGTVYHGLCLLGEENNSMIFGKSFDPLDFRKVTTRTQREQKRL